MDCAGVAQLARAPVCHTGGCEFESRHPLLKLDKLNIKKPIKGFYFFKEI